MMTNRFKISLLAPNTKIQNKYHDEAKRALSFLGIKIKYHEFGLFSAISATHSANKFYIRRFDAPNDTPTSA
jgi:hypothetical protein